MMTRLADRMILAAVQESTAAIAEAPNNPDLEWEEVSALAGRQNVRLLNILDHADEVAEQFLDDVALQVSLVGMCMFQEAVPHVKDPDDVLYLAEGINVLAARVRESADQGAPLPMHYMDPKVRKELFLLESYLKVPQSKNGSDSTNHE